MIYERELEDFHCSCLKEQLESCNCCGSGWRDWHHGKCWNFRRELYILLEQVWILWLNVTTKCSLIGFVWLRERKKASGREGLCEFSFFQVFSLDFWALLPEFPCPAWDLAASLKKCWIYFILATFAPLRANLCFNTFGIWQEFSCLMKISWIWSEAPTMGEQFLSTFPQLLFPPCFHQLWICSCEHLRFPLKGLIFLCTFPMFFSQIMQNQNSTWAHFYVSYI